MNITRAATLLKVRLLVPSQAQRERINLISVMTNQGAIRFMLYSGRLTAGVFINFLERFIDEAAKKVFLVLDDLRVQRGHKVRQWLQDKSHGIGLFFLPRYSSELNPDEYLKTDLKAHMNAAESVCDPTPLRRKVLSRRRSLQRQPSRIRSYFEAVNIKYAL